LHFREKLKQVRVKYIGLKGVGKGSKRDVVHAKYEVLATKENHANIEDITQGQFMGT